MKQKKFIPKPSKGKHRVLRLGILLFACVSLVFTSCEEEISHEDAIEQKVLTSTRWLPTEIQNLENTRVRVENIYLALDTLSQFVSSQQNLELHEMYINIVVRMNTTLEDLKKAEKAQRRLIQDYSFYINHYGVGKQEVELKDKP